MGTERAWTLASARRVPLALRDEDFSWNESLFNACVAAAPSESRSREGALTDAQQHASWKGQDFTYGEIGSARFARCVGLARRLSPSGCARTFVDVGCGAGRSLAAAASLESPVPFRHLVGVELSPSLAASARGMTAAAPLDGRETYILECDAVADARWARLPDAVFWICWLTWTTETRNALAAAAERDMPDGAVVISCGWALPSARFCLAFTFHTDVSWGTQAGCVLFVAVKLPRREAGPAATPRAARRRGATLCRLTEDGATDASDTVPAGLAEDADLWLGAERFDVVVDEDGIFKEPETDAATRAVAYCAAARSRRRADAVAAIVADGDGYLLTKTPNAPALGAWRRRPEAPGAAEGWAALAPPPRAALPATRDDRACTFSLTGKRGARQVLFTCFTCCADGCIEVCPACAANCHRGHHLILAPDAPAAGGDDYDDDPGFCACGYACGSCRLRCR